MVKGTAKDVDGGISSVTVEVNDKSGFPILPSQIINYNGETSVNFSFKINVENLYISSGTYNVRIKASDGDISSSKNVDLQISIPPLEVEKIYLFSYNGTGTDVYEYAFGGNVLVNTLSTDVNQVYCDSKNKHIIVGGAKSNISFYDDTFNLKYAINSKSTFFPFFHNYTQSAFSDYFHFYVCDEEGFISRYLEKSILDLRFKTDPSGSALLPYYFSNIETGYTIVDMHDVANSNEALHTYYTSTGYLINSTPFVNKELVGVGDFSNNTPLLFINENGVGQVVSYNIKDNLLAKLKDISGKILDVYQITTDNYLLATDNGVVKYTYSSSSAVTVNSYVCSKFITNKVSGTILGISNNTIIEMDPNGNASVFSINTTNIDGVAVIYSR